eukprot:1842738-Amphidinium_carterae.2
MQITNVNASEVYSEVRERLEDEQVQRLKRTTHLESGLEQGGGGGGGTIFGSDNVVLTARSDLCAFREVEICDVLKHGAAVMLPSSITLLKPLISKTKHGVANILRISSLA